MEAAREQGRGDGGVRVAFWLSWLLAGLCVAISVATFPLFVLARSAQVPRSWGVNLSIGGLLGVVIFLVFPLVGALIASRRRGETDLDGLNSELVAVVRETVRPTHAYLWLRPSDARRASEDPHP